MAEPPTVKPKPFCGICACVVSNGEMIIKLYGNDTYHNFSSPSAFTTPDLFVIEPSPDHPGADQTEVLEEEDDGPLPSEVAGEGSIGLLQPVPEEEHANPYQSEVSEGEHSDAPEIEVPERHTVHESCFKVLMRRCNELMAPEDVLDFIWIMIAWRAPWKGAELNLGRSPGDVPSWSMLSKVLGGKLDTTPPEIQKMVYYRSMDSFLWKCVDAWEIGSSAENAQKNAVSIPISRLSSWTRGGAPQEREDSSSAHCIARITFDNHGVKEFTLLSGMPSFKHNRVNHQLFAFMDSEQLSKDPLIAHFAYGKMRLEQTKPLSWSLWDTPTPPCLRECSFYEGEPDGVSPLKTINPRQVTGLTMIFIRGQLWIIHAHTRDGRREGLPFDRLALINQRRAVWVYLPLPESDTLLDLIVEQTPRSANRDRAQSIIVRMEKAKHTRIGYLYYPDRPWSNKFALFSSADLLVYQQRHQLPIDVMGSLGNQRDDYPRLSTKWPDTPPPGAAYYSGAPLANLREITVYHDPSGVYTQGVLLEYHDGSQRTVGQCRIGIDQCTRWQLGSHIHIRRTQASEAEGGLWLFKIRGDSREEWDFNKPGGMERYMEEQHMFQGSWDLYELSGNLYIWFDHQETYGFIEQ